MDFIRGTAMKRRIGLLVLGLSLISFNTSLLPSTVNRSSPVDVTRKVATIYQIQAGDQGVACLHEPNTKARTTNILKNGQLVDLVALEEGMVKKGQDYWLHVYPRLSHRPACYINTRALVPIA
jgi:hypothetical protein